MWGRVARRVALGVLVAVSSSAACTGGEPERAGPGSTGPPDISLPPPAEPAPVPAPDPAAAERLAVAVAGDPDRANIDAAVEVLARAGIRTYDDETLGLLQHPVGEPFALNLLELQVANMTEQAIAGAGRTGEQLSAFADDLAPGAPDGALSLLLAAYVTVGETFGAEFSRALMGPLDVEAHDRIVFPDLVVALFLSDVFEHTDPGGAPPPIDDYLPPGGSVSGAVSAGSFLAAGAAVVAGPAGLAPQLGPSVTRACNEARALLDRLRAILDGVIPMTGTAADILLALLQAGVSAATRALVDTLLASLRAALGPIPGLLASASVMAYVGSLADQWAVTIRSEPPGFLHYGVEGGGGTDARFAGTVSNHFSIPWPPPLVACAAVLGLTLPQTQDPAGSRIEYTPRLGAHATATGTPDQAVRADGGFEFPIQLRDEPAETHLAGGRVCGDLIDLGVSISREVDKEKIREFIQMLFSLPTVVAEVAADVAQGLAQQFHRYEVQGVAAVQWHGPPPPASIDLVEDFVRISGGSPDGLYGTWTIRVVVAGDAVGQASTSFTVRPGGPSPLRWRVPIVIEDAGGAYVFSGTVAAVGGPDAPALRIRGTARSVPAVAGGVAEYDSTHPVTLGDPPGCR